MLKGKVFKYQKYNKHMVNDSNKNKRQETKPNPDTETELWVREIYIPWFKIMSKHLWQQILIKLYSYFHDRTGFWAGDALGKQQSTSRGIVQVVITILTIPMLIHHLRISTINGCSVMFANKAKMFEYPKYEYYNYLERTV